MWPNDTDPEDRLINFLLTNARMGLTITNPGPKNSPITLMTHEPGLYPTATIIIINLYLIDKKK